jgi:acyl transferase domain-containing protein
MDTKEKFKRQILMMRELKAFKRTHTEPIAIIGMACRFPGGADNPEQYWQLLRNGVDAVTEIPRERWNADDYYDPDPEAKGKMYVRESGFLQEPIDQFDPDFFGISPREAKSMDPQQRLLLEVSWEALENAGQLADNLKRSQTGIFIGMSINEYGQLIFSKDLDKIDVYAGTGNGFCFSAGRLSYFLGLHGPSIALDTACSSSLTAIHLACQSLHFNECRLALAGGSQLILMPNYNIWLARAQAFSPDGRCKSFDASADGLGRGEGCGMIVLKRLSDAQADGDKILAVIRGSGINHDGPSSGLTVPNKQAQEDLIKQVLKKANVKPGDISYIEAHGTGTSLGDPIEVRALAAALGQGRSMDNPFLIGSAKSNIAHLESAAGVAGVIKTVLQLQRKEIPANPHFKEPNPNIDWKDCPVKVPAKRTPWLVESGQKRLAGVSAFGMSGTNAHIILEEAHETVSPTAKTENKTTEPAIKRPAHLLTLSAKTDQALLDLSQKHTEFFESHPEISLADICYTANTKRSCFDHRLAVVAGSLEELRKQLQTFIEGEHSVAVTTGQVINKTNKIAFLFTGQGSQYIGMGKELYETQPVFKKTLDHCAEILSAHLEKPLLEVVFAQDSDSNDFKFNDSIYAQPALFALEYALAQLWKSWGIIPKSMIGHSIGEYVAACLAGVFSLEHALDLVFTRSRLAKELAPEGRMLTIMLSEKEVLPYLNSNQQLFLSVSNGHFFSVVSGSIEAVDNLRKTLLKNSIACQYLEISRPFHSPMMEAASEALTKKAQAIQLNPPEIPYLSNLTGTWITDEQAVDPGYWAGHLCQTVKFDQGIQELFKKSNQILLELGPDQTLSLLLEMHPNKTDEQLVLSSMNNPQDKEKKRPDPEFLFSAASQLWVAGVKIDWSEFYADAQYQPVVLPNYAWQRQRYWIDTEDSQQEDEKLPATSIVNLLNTGDAEKLIQQLESTSKKRHPSYNSQTTLHFPGGYSRKTEAEFRKV